MKTPRHLKEIAVPNLPHNKSSTMYRQVQRLPSDTNQQSRD